MWARTRVRAGLGAGRDESDMGRLSTAIACVVGACLIAMVSLVVWSVKSMFKAPDDDKLADADSKAGLEQEFDDDGAWKGSGQELECESGLRRPRGQGGIFDPRPPSPPPRASSHLLPYGSPFIQNPPLWCILAVTYWLHHRFDPFTLPTLRRRFENPMAAGPE